MRKISLLTLCLFALLAQVSAQVPVEKVVGVWETYDDKTGKAESVVKIFKATNGMYYGKLLDIYDEKVRASFCTKCKGDDKDKPVVGLIFMREMKIEGDVLRGYLLDPSSGNTYYGAVSLVDENKLKLRGSLDRKGVLGRTQYWKRSK